MSWWLAGLLIWVAAAVGLAAVVALSARSRRGARPEETDPLLRVASTMTGLLDALLSELGSRPETLDRLSWVEDVVAEGRGLVRMLDDEVQRLGRQVEAVLEVNAPYAERQAAERARRRRELANRASALRHRLDAVQRHLATRTTRGPYGPSSRRR